MRLMRAVENDVVMFGGKEAGGQSDEPRRRVGAWREQIY
jgi:hypothetical protein